MELRFVPSLPALAAIPSKVHAVLVGCRASGSAGSIDAENCPGRDDMHQRATGGRALRSELVDSRAQRFPRDERKMPVDVSENPAGIRHN